MIRTLALLAMTAALASPALAEGMAGDMAGDMACSSFNSLDHDGMVAAMQAAGNAHDAMAADGGAMASDGAMATETPAETPAKKAGDMTGDMTGDMAADSGMMGQDADLAALTKACADHPDMMVKDAMTPMK